MMKDILIGATLTTVFKSMLLEDSSLTNADISAVFQGEFERVSSEAVQVIWHWNRPGGAHGAEDQRIDELLLHYLSEAGYL